MSSAVYILLFVTGSQVLLSADAVITVTPSNYSITVAWEGYSSYKNLTITLDTVPVQTVDPAEDSSYDIMNLQPGQSYSIAVNGYNSLDVLEPLLLSKSYSTAPLQPISLRVTSSNANSIKLSWDQNPGSQSGSSYRVEYENPPGNALSGSVGISTYEVTGLSSGVTYTFKVYAVSGTSDSVPAVISATTAPLAPNIASVTDESTTELNVMWTPSASSIQDAYKVTYSKVGVNSVTDSECTSSPCTIDVSSQGIPGSRFLITVYAVSKGVDSAGATAYGNTKPEAPGDLTVSMASTDTLVLLSAVPSGSTIDSKNIVISPTLPTDNVNVAQELPNFTITLSRLTAGGKYDIEFSTQSGQAESDKVRGTFYSKPPTPSAPSHQSGTTDSLTVTWIQPATGALDKYVIAIVDGESKNVTIKEDKTATFMGLVAGSTYSVRLRTVVGTGASEVWSDPATTDMTTKPLPATDIDLTARTTNSLTVTWKGPTSGTFASFEASLSGVTNSKRTVKAGSTYVITFSSLTPGTEFTVEIITGSGNQNSEVAQRKYYTAPSAPGNFRQTAVNNETITIGWTKPTLGNWDKYEVRIALEGGTVNKSDLVRETITKQFTGLQPATRYTIQLRTVVSNVSGTDQTLTVLTNPNPPKAIMFSNKGTTSVGIQWTPPDHGVNGYKFSVTKTGAQSPSSSSSPPSPSAMVTNLEPGATYDVRVISLKNTGLGTISESVPLTRKVTMVPNEAGNFGMKDRGQDYIEVQWNDPDNEYSSFKLAITGQNTVTVGRGTNIHKFNGLGPGQTYSISIKTVSNMVESPGVSRTLQTEPSTVTSLNIGTVTSTTIPVAWAEPTGTVITSYELRINPHDEGEQSMTINVNRGDDSAYNFNDLKPGRTYTVSIYVKAGTSTSSPVSKTVTTKPLPVTVLQTTGGTVITTAFQTQWSVNQNSKQQSFQIKYIQADGGNFVEESVSPNQGLLYTFTINNLGPGKTYTVEVYAISNNVNGDSVSYNQTTSPSPVSMFSATGTGTTVDLTWVLNTQSVQDSYELNYRGQIQATEWTMAQTITATSTTIENLFPGDKYTFQIVAISNGQKSDTREVQKVTNPLPPQGLKVEEVTTNTIRVVWDYDSTTTYNTQYNISQSLTATNDPKVVGTTALNSRIVTVSGLTSGANYTISVYAMTIDNVESLVASTVKATVKPVITSTLSDVRGETTNVTAVVSYTESNDGDFDKYRINITVNGEERSRVKVKGDQVRKASFDTLTPGTQYRISAITISGDQESTAVTAFIVTMPNPPKISCTSFQDGLQVMINKAFGLVTSCYVECVGTNCPQSPSQVPFNQGQASHTFYNLVPYTDYTVKVKSEVVHGADSKKSIETTRTCRTSESAPEAVDTFTFGDILLPYKVTLFWGEPKVLNGILTAYLITYKGTKQNKPETEEIESLIEDVDINEKTVTDLKAGYTYVFSIQAKTVDYGDQRNISVTLPIEPPFKDINTYSKSQPEMIAAGAHDWLDILFVNPFSNKNGEITGYSIIVMSYPTQLETGADVDYNWRTASNQKPMGAYAAIHKCPDLFTVGNKCWGFVAPASRKKRAVGSVVTIRVGGDPDCSLGSEGYCNGPLQPESSYYIILRAYTENGLFADSPISDVFTTAPKPIPNFLIPTIVSILALLILAIVLLAVIVLWRKGKICKGDQSEEGYDFDYLDRPRSSRFSYCNPVNRKEFGSHVRLMAADCDFRFAEEFESLKPVGTDAPHKASEEDANRLKNRFTNILPYDHSRVKLLPTDDEDGSDYINANWMPGYSSKREFLVCQGPLPATRDDFWRMVWEHNAVGIVMLTGCVEKGKEKCDHYWPVDTEPMFYGDLQVVILNETKSPHWVITQFKISKGEQSRKLCHYHFIAWKDFGVPEEGPGILVRFVRLVRERLGFDKSPIVVHCSAGVGRSGTYIAVDNLMQRIKEHDSLDVLSTVYDMRRHRCFMVQTEQQYIFIHQCLLYVLEKREKELDIYDSTHENDGFDDEGIAEH